MVANVACKCLMLNKIVDNYPDLSLCMAITKRTMCAVCHRAGRRPRAQSCMPLMLAKADVKHEITNVCRSGNNMHLKVGFQKHRTRALLKHLAQADTLYAQDELQCGKGAMKGVFDLWLKSFTIVVTRLDSIEASFHADALLFLARRVHLDLRKSVIGWRIAY